MCTRTSGGTDRLQIALHQRDVHVFVHVILVATKLEFPVFRIDRLIVDPLHRSLVFQPVAYEIRNGADLQAVSAREQLQIRTPRHGAVLVQDLHDGRRGAEAREPRQIAAGLGVPGARQHAAGLRHQREYVSRLAQILGPRVGRHRGTDGVRTVVRRYSRGHALRRLDRHREIGPVQSVGVAHHERQAQLAAAITRQCQTDQAAPVARHEIHVLGTDTFGRHHQIALVLAILVIHDHGHFAVAQVAENLIDGVE